MSSTEIISLLREIDYSLEDVDLLDAVSVTASKWEGHLDVNLLAELS
jgi:hypothetical protein